MILIMTELKDILRSTTSSIENSITNFLSKLDEKLDGRKSVEKEQEEKLNKTPCDSVVDNRTNSPFISDDGGLVNLSQKSTTKRKLEMDEDDDFEKTEEEVVIDFESISARKFRFDKPQFPRGLVTIKEDKDEPQKEGKKSNNKRSSDKTPNSEKTPKSAKKGELNITTSDEIQTSKLTERRTLRRHILENPTYYEEVSQAPCSKKRCNKKLNPLENGVLVCFDLIFNNCEYKTL